MTDRRTLTQRANAEHNGYWPYNDMIPQMAREQLALMDRVDELEQKLGRQPGPEPRELTISELLQLIRSRVGSLEADGGEYTIEGPHLRRLIEATEKLTYLRDDLQKAIWNAHRDVGGDHVVAAWRLSKFLERSAP